MKPAMRFTIPAAMSDNAATGLDDRAPSGTSSGVAVSYRRRIATRFLTARISQAHTDRYHPVWSFGCNSRCIAARITDCSTFARGTEKAPRRPSLLVTTDAEILLMEFEVRTGRFVWITPGGGLEEGEDVWDGVAREVLEETGHRIDTGVPVWTREEDFELEGVPVRQHETFFYVRAARL